MKSIKYVAWLGAFSLALFSCSGENNPNNSADSNETDSEKVYPVKVQSISEEPVERTLDYTANLTAYKEVNYGPASPGRINQINVEVGSRVNKGQVLVQMDKTQLYQAQTQYENAKYNFLRIDTLHQLGSISEQQYEQTKTQYEVAKSSYEYLKENTTLVSPFNGLVTGKYFENGEMYLGSPNAATGKAGIITLMQINPLKAMVGVSQTYYPVVKKGMKATISTDIFPNENFVGTIAKVYPTIDPSTRTFQVEIIVENNQELLKPGMYANIQIELAKENALVVPAIAVIKQEGTNARYVYLAENDEARQVRVEIGKRYDDKVEIISSEIKTKDKLIYEGQANLINGSSIKIIAE